MIVAFPLLGDGPVSDIDDFARQHDGRILRGSISRSGIPLVHVEVPDHHGIAADILRRRLCAEAA